MKNQNQPADLGTPGRRLTGAGMILGFAMIGVAVLVILVGQESGWAVLIGVLLGLAGMGVTALAIWADDLLIFLFGDRDKYGNQRS